MSEGTISEAAAYYHWPAFWVGDRPTLLTHTDVSTLGEEVYRTHLSAGIDARVLREGMFIFGFSGWPPGQGLPWEPMPDFEAFTENVLARTRVMNAHLACLHTALGKLQKHPDGDGEMTLTVPHGKMIVEPANRFSLQAFDDLSVTLGDSLNQQLILTQIPSSYDQSLPPHLDWRIIGRHLLVEIATVEESFRLLESILDSSSSNTLILSDMYWRSCNAYEDHNYPLCLVTAWTVTENLLQTLWKRYIEGNRKRNIDGQQVTFINSERKKNLLQGQNFSASVVSEILSLTDLLPLDIYKDLSETRSVRNDWVHDLKPVSREAAETSIRVAERMLNLVEKLSLEVPLRAYIPGG